MPLAQQDIITFAPGEPVRIEQDTLLANDSDPGGDPLEAIIISEPQFGEINFTEGGGFEYIPDDEIPFTSDTVFYVASDGYQSDTSFVVLSKLAVGVDLADIMKLIQFTLISTRRISDLTQQLNLTKL